jgi:hypothetical protein
VPVPWPVTATVTTAGKQAAQRSPQFTPAKAQSKAQSEAPVRSQPAWRRAVGPPVRSLLPALCRRARAPPRLAGAGAVWTSELLPFWILDCTCHPGTFRLNEMCTSTCPSYFSLLSNGPTCVFGPCTIRFRLLASTITPSRTGNS